MTRKRTMSASNTRRTVVFNGAPCGKSNGESESVGMEEMRLTIVEQRRRIQSLELELALVRSQQ
jgi:hypothetical protein